MDIEREQERFNNEERELRIRAENYAQAKLLEYSEKELLRSRNKMISSVNPPSKPSPMASSNPCTRPKLSVSHMHSTPKPSAPSKVLKPPPPPKPSEFYAISAPLVPPKTFKPPKPSPLYLLSQVTYHKGRWMTPRPKRRRNTAHSSPEQQPST